MATIETSDAVSSRSTSRIAATSVVRWCSPSGASNEWASSSLRRSRIFHSLRPFGVSRGRPHASVGIPGSDDHEPVALERAQHSAQVAGVEVQAATQRPHLTVAPADLPEHSRLAERPAPPEVGVVQRAHPLGHGAIEAPNLGNEVVSHISDCSQISFAR